MLSPKRFVQIARNGQKFSSSPRSKIMSPKSDMETTSSASTSSIAEKGHLVVYTIDERRFVVLIMHLSNPIFRELFKMSEDEFGLPGDGPITLPCQATFMEYILSLLKRSLSKDVEKALLISIATCRSSTSSVVYDDHTKERAHLYAKPIQRNPLHSFPNFESVDVP